MGDSNGKDKDVERGIGEIADMNLQAKESSKAEEIAAICKLHGCDPSAPLSLQLKALDTEYHRLLDNGQGDKAEHVQGLYVWKKEARQKLLEWLNSEEFYESTNASKKDPDAKSLVLQVPFTSGTSQLAGDGRGVMEHSGDYAQYMMNFNTESPDLPPPAVNHKHPMLASLERTPWWGYIPQGSVPDNSFWRKHIPQVEKYAHMTNPCTYNSFPKYAIGVGLSMVVAGYLCYKSFIVLSPKRFKNYLAERKSQLEAAK